MKPLPESIRIGPFDFAVEEWPSQLASVAQRYGECDRINNVIRVRTDAPPQRQAEVLLHEVLHAVWECGACDTADEEKLCSIFGMSLAQVWRDNPAFVAFMSDALGRTA